MIGLQEKWNLINKSRLVRRERLFQKQQARYEGGWKLLRDEQEILQRCDVAERWPDGLMIPRTDSISAATTAVVTISAVLLFNQHTTVQMQQAASPVEWSGVE